MSERITWQGILLLVLEAATLTMVVGVAIVTMFLPAPEPIEEDHFELTSGPTWYHDLKAKSDEQLADPEAVIKIEIGKLQQMQIIESFNQASSLCPPPTPGSKPSDS